MARAYEEVEEGSDAATDTRASSSRFSHAEQASSVQARRVSAQLDAKFRDLLQSKTQARLWATNGKKSSSSYQPPHHRYLTKKTLCKVTGDGTAERVPLNVSDRPDVLRSWRPCATPALPPKLTFFGEYRERCGDAQPHLRTAWVVHPVRVDYDVRSQRVTARCDGQDLGMTITSAMGMALEPWDLHVGAILNVLDRRVTLRNANLATRLWLVSQADRLVKERRLLERELNKFTHVSAVAQEYGRHYVLAADDWNRIYHNPIDPKFSSRGNMNLRRLMQEVEELRIRLAQFRRRLPAYGLLTPEDGLHLTGPFETPVDWHGDRAATQAQPQKAPLIIVDDSSRKKPQGYIDWLDSIALASSAAYTPTVHMAGAAKYRQAQVPDREDSQS